MTRFRDPDFPNIIHPSIRDAFENVGNILNNGKYVFRVVSTAPTETNADVGEAALLVSGSTFEIYFFTGDDGWKKATLS